MRSNAWKMFEKCSKAKQFQWNIPLNYSGIQRSISRRETSGNDCLAIYYIYVRDIVFSIQWIATNIRVLCCPFVQLHWRRAEIFSYLSEEIIARKQFLVRVLQVSKID